MRALLICGILLFSGAATARTATRASQAVRRPLPACRQQCPRDKQPEFAACVQDAFGNSTIVKSSATCDIPTRGFRRRNSDVYSRASCRTMCR